ncbi:M12 family metallopeptidase [Niabella pedocola]|uniref:M12 family metallopeptidase n=1 Tax=Niabella pedocola TaxID=1752077 RepID=A0ABS8PVL3_9BACT|nr:M12 family metallopeptidase [Niabella pedocola]MCD2425116.1 M12 family metallopeptidase [Niabella pedocola]
MKRRPLLSLTIFFGCLVFCGACKREIRTPYEDEKAGNEAQYSSHRLNDSTIIHRFVVDGTVNFVNETNGLYYYSDDIVLTPEQFGMLKHLSSHLPTTQRSTITQRFIQTWPNGVVYYRLPVNDGSLTSTQYGNFLRTIDSAFNVIESRTPVRFVERSTQAEYITFVKSTGNSSPLGWSKNRVNTIQLYNYTHPYITAHEIMHSLGIKHEQCRPDRDQYVVVDLSKVEAGKEHNYNIAFDYAGEGPFDFGSVMLYSSTSFAIDSDDPPMTRLDGSTFVGQRSRLSEGDFAGITHLYAPFNTAALTNGIYRIGTPLSSAKSFDIQGGRTDNGTPVILYSNHTGKNQQFLFRKVEHGYFIIKSMVDTSKVLTVRSAGTANGTVVELKAYAGTDAQKWYLYNLGNNGFGFSPKHASSLRLEIKGGQTSDLTPIVVGAVSDNATKQQFVLTKLN